jgi:hypothetical protein
MNVNRRSRRLVSARSGGARHVRVRITVVTRTRARPRGPRPRASPSAVVLVFRHAPSQKVPTALSP